jgi:exodeoxyribonuclease-3
LISKPLVDRVSWVLVDRNARKGKLPSDHAPLIVDVADEKSR